MDSLSYKYNAGTNQLNHVRDNVPAGDYTPPAYADLDDQAADNYGYDEIGNLIRDDAEGVTGIEWNVYGKIMHISFSSTTVGESKNVYFYYDAAGNRVGKRNEKNSATGVTTDYVWQVRDASGNVMAIYSTQASSGYNIPTSLSVKERHLYGSSRLGISFLKKDAKTIPSFTQTTPYNLSWIRGNKSYELTNHLGNVLSTVSDIKFGVDTDSNGVIDYYTADVVGARDYLPFGNTMPARSTGVSYRYEFNGKEKDREGPVQFDYGFRIYDPRLGRFKSVDPLAHKLPSWSPYSMDKDNPILYVDVDGAFPYTFHIRAFAPPGSFSRPFQTGFHDDNRGFSTSMNVTSRIKQNFTVDPTARTFSGGTPTSDPTFWTVGNRTFSKTATDEGGISTPEFGKNSSGSATATLSSNFKGSNPFGYGAAPNIEVSSAISITENLKTNQVFVALDLSSKQFPATEGIIQDAAGNSVFLAGAAAYGTAVNLGRADKEKIATVDLTIGINNKGVFQNVTIGGKTYSLADFNKLGTSKPAGPLPREDKDKQ